MSIKQTLGNIQTELKAPKSQYNSFGKYHYRSCEDILEALKPLCNKYEAFVTVSDEMVLVGDRIYVKATATISDCKSDESVSTTAYAREEDTKKGMDGSQITGAASSYARKYALNGLFCIDDTKDADSDVPEDKAPAKVEKPKAEKPVEKPKSDKAFTMCEDCGRPIVDIVINEQKWSRKVIEQKTKQTYGKCLCWDCASKAKDKKSK